MISPAHVINCEGSLAVGASVVIFNAAMVPHVSDAMLRFELVLSGGALDETSAAVDYPLELILDTDTATVDRKRVWLFPSSAHGARVAFNLPVVYPDATNPFTLSVHNPVGSVGAKTYAVKGAALDGCAHEGISYPVLSGNVPGGNVDTNYRHSRCVVTEPSDCDSWEGLVNNTATAGDLHARFCAYIPTADGGPNLVYVTNVNCPPTTTTTVSVPKRHRYTLLRFIYTGSPTAPGFKYCCMG